MTRTLIALAAAAALVPLAACAEGKEKGRYLVVAPHTAEQCLAVLDDIHQHDKALLEKIDWG